MVVPSFIVVSRDLALCNTVHNVGRAFARHVVAASSSDDVIAAIAAVDASGRCDVLIDRDHDRAAEVLGHLVATADPRVGIVVVVRDAIGPVPPGVHAVVFAAAVDDLLRELAAPRPDRKPIALERLLGASMLAGPITDAIEAHATLLAACFDVDRCVISLRGDPTGGVAGADHTVDLPSWNATAQRCREAAAAEATLIAPGAADRPCESYLAVPLTSQHAGHGFVGLVNVGPRVFSIEARSLLRRLAARFGDEIGWRTAHERMLDTLDRLVNEPGIDPLLNIWNRPATTQLGWMYVSLAKRSKLPLTVLALPTSSICKASIRATGWSPAISCCAAWPTRSARRHAPRT